MSEKNSPAQEQSASQGQNGSATPSQDQAGERGWFLPQDTRDYLRELLGKLPKPVHVELFTKDGLNDRYNEFARNFLGDMAALSENIRLSEHSLDHEHAKKRGVDGSPEILVEPDRYKLRFSGAPAGEEARGFLETLILAAAGQSGLAGPVQKMLAGLEQPRQAMVFVSPTCPFCPGQVLNGVKAAIERPDLISFRMVEIGENPELSDKHNVGSVPHTVYSPGPGAEGEPLDSLGLEPEARFALQLANLVPADTWLAEHGGLPGAGTGPDAGKEVDVVILGGGPAGLTAAIYAVRAGLSAVVLEKKNVGGQVAITPEVENYPGFIRIPGAKLVDIMAEHARQYSQVLEYKEVLDIKLGKRIEVLTAEGDVFACKALILAMGATWKQLNAPGEQRFFGRGVSYCASCDGFFYRGKKVAVVGGGNTAITDALHLRHLGADVTLIHRRDHLRAEKHLQDALEREHVPVLWNTEVRMVLGDDRLNGLVLKNTATGEESDLPVDGVFLAIAQRANSELAQTLGVVTDEGGFIQVDGRMRTNLPRVYAAGDITGGIRQIVTAVGQGTSAALAVHEDLVKRGDV